MVNEKNKNDNDIQIAEVKKDISYILENLKEHKDYHEKMQKNIDDHFAKFSEEFSRMQNTFIREKHENEKTFIQKKQVIALVTGTGAIVAFLVNMTSEIISWFYKG